MLKPSVETRIHEFKAEGMGILKIGRTVGVGTSVVQGTAASQPMQNKRGVKCEALP